MFVLLTRTADGKTWRQGFSTYDAANTVMSRNAINGLTISPTANMFAELNPTFPKNFKRGNYNAYGTIGCRMYEVDSVEDALLQEFE